MGKGDLSGSPHSIASPDDANTRAAAVIRSRHLSNGSAIPASSQSDNMNGYHSNGVVKEITIKHRLQNICSNRDSLFSKCDSSKMSTRKKEKDKEMNCRNYTTLAIMLLANLINYMDRYTIAGVLDEVRQFYQIDFSQTGLLQTSFIISYMLLSPVFGYLGDRYNRKYIMSAGVMFWSIITLAGSFVDKDKYTLFLMLRALVGVGEASYSTIAPTIIADVFSKSTRTKALSIFYFAIPVGSGLGYIVGSKVASFCGNWQWALRVTPFFGVLCSILVLIVVTEPARGASDGGVHMSSTSAKSDLCYLMKHKSFMLSSLGFTCVAFVAGALAFWAPLYVYKSVQVQHIDGLSQDSVSLIFGVITCVAGFAGVVVGSYAAHLLRPRTAKADPLVCGVGMIASAPFLYCAIVCSNHSFIATWILIFIAETLLSLNWALVTDILLYIVIPTRRSMAEAVQILLSHALGDAGSPYLVGLMTDVISNSYPRRDNLVEFISLQYALYISCFVCVLGGALFLATALFIQQDRQQTELAIKGSNAKGIIPSVLAENGQELCCLNSTSNGDLTPNLPSSEELSEESGSTQDGVLPLLTEPMTTCGSVNS